MQRIGLLGRSGAKQVLVVVTRLDAAIGEQTLALKVLQQALGTLVGANRASIRCGDPWCQRARHEDVPIFRSQAVEYDVGKVTEHRLPAGRFGLLCMLDMAAPAFQCQPGRPSTAGTMQVFHLVGRRRAAR